MHRIAGFVWLDGRECDAAYAARMLRRVTRDGYGAAKIKADGPAGLGSVPFFPVAGRDPSVRQGPYLIAADVRLDNRAELNARLNLPPDKASDSELICAAYRRWGNACTTRLDGDFAVAIWDPGRQALFCARDHAGVKPFFYTFRPDRFVAVSSEISQLLTLDEVSKELDEVQISKHLLAPIPDTFERTFYKEIKALPPAHYLSVQDRRLIVEPYWELTLGDELRLGSDAEYAEGLRELFFQAVRRRIGEDRDLGVMVSGGLDSSGIACAADRIYAPGRPLHTYSAIYPSVPASDESKFIYSVLNCSDRFAPTILEADGKSPLQPVPAIGDILSAPSAAPNLYINWNLYESARSQGIKIILDGYDGDTTISHGRGLFTELAHNRNRIRLYREVAAFARAIDEPWPAAVWAWMRKMDVDPLLTRVHPRRLLKRLLPQNGVKRTVGASSDASWRHRLNPDFADRIAYAIEKDSALAHTERGNHLRLLRRPVLAETTQILDNTAASYGIEMRFPFFDRELIEFCLSVPAEQKMSNGWSRKIYRLAMEGTLPSDVQWRLGKSNHEFGMVAGLRRHEAERLKNMLHLDIARMGDFVDIKAYRETISGFMVSDDKEVDKIFLWRLLSLSSWLEGSQSA